MDDRPGPLSTDRIDFREWSASLGELSFRSGGNSGKAKCEKDWNWKPKPLSDYDLWYVLSGYGRIRIGPDVHSITPGSCFLLRPGEVVFAEQDPVRRLTVIFVHFRTEPSIPGKSAPMFKATAPHLHPESVLHSLPTLVVIRDAAWFESLLNRLLTLDEEVRTPATEAEFDAVLKAALLSLLRESASERARGGSLHPAVRQAIRLMKENAASPLTHEQLAEITGTSARYLNVLFKTHTGTSVKTYLARVRVERACQLLAESTMNVSQIADTLGYADIYFFSKQFKQFTGESPTRYRSRAHESRSH
ncbi:helix-turn-helix domain-containing protein [Cohnella sp.]|uniref:helix-turn-helix domain-containing protein n=1 Tax=Cohnella sp. TaxID=1883426 RepID=UPI003568E312